MILIQYFVFFKRPIRYVTEWTMKRKAEKNTILLVIGSDSRSLSTSDGSIDAERATTTQRVLAITATAIVNAMMRFVDILLIELQINKFTLALALVHV